MNPNWKMMNLKNYKAKAEYYIRQHQDNDDDMQSLKTNQPLDNNGCC